ncbi:MAG: type III secretion system chaperone [Pseudomonadota bacterium]
MKSLFVPLILSALVSGSVVAQDDVPLPPDAPEEPEVFIGPMTGERLGAVIQQIDANAIARGNGYIFRVGERDMMTVFDENADRMRVISPIISAEDLPPELLERMLQANYDAVLDARYAIANGQVWAVFIHPLSSLTDDQLLSGIAQTAIAVETFGTAFTSGIVTFGGGDSQGIYEDLQRRLEEFRNGPEEDRGI